MKELCATKDDTLGLVVDYMQNLYPPFIPVQEMFYNHKLSVYSFGVHNLKMGEVLFYMYNESATKKGANEVCSFLYDYIQKNVPSHIRKLYIFFDNCEGQNKNTIVLKLWSVLRDSSRFDFIEHIFPIRGHSFNPCDSDFAVAKRLIRTRDRIYTVRTFMTLIIQASECQVFRVTLVQSSQVLDFKTWSTQHFKKTVSSFEDKKQKFAIQSYHQFTFTTKNGTGMTVRRSIDHVTSFKFHLRKSPRLINPANQDWPSPVTHEFRALKAEKWNQQLQLLWYIPQHHMDY